MIEWKWDWQHVALAIAGLVCMSTVIILGHGQTVLQLFAALGGSSGLLMLFKGSPAKPKPDIIIEENLK